MDEELRARAEAGNEAALLEYALAMQRGEGLPEAAPPPRDPASFCPWEAMDQLVADIPPMPGFEKGHVNGRKGWCRRTLVAAAKRVAGEVGEPLSVHRFCKHARCSDATVQRHFPGGWAELRDEAGLEAAPRSVFVWSEDALLEEYDRLVTELGRRPNWAEIDRLSECSSSTYRRAFGKRADVERAYDEWLATR